MSLGSMFLDGPGEPRLTFQVGLGLRARGSQRDWTSIKGNLDGGDDSHRFLISRYT
jgi:hypothetical protein